MTLQKIKAKSFLSVLSNSEALMQTMVEIRTLTLMSQPRQEAFIEVLESLFGLMLGEIVFSLTDNLSCTLQSKSITACAAKNACDITCKQLMRRRSDEEFDTFWQETVSKCTKLQLSQPQLPRARRPPKRYDYGDEPATFRSPCKRI